MMKPILYLLEHPDVIAEKVAQQMGMSRQEAAVHMAMWDEISIRTFRVGNHYPKRELH